MLRSTPEYSGVSLISTHPATPPDSHRLSFIVGKISLAELNFFSFLVCVNTTSQCKKTLVVVVNLVRGATTILTSRHQTDSFISFSFLFLFQPRKILGAILWRREKADSRAYFLLVVRTTTSPPMPGVSKNEIPLLCTPYYSFFRLCGAFPTETLLYVQVVLSIGLVYPNQLIA